MYCVRRDSSKQQLWERLLSEAYRSEFNLVNQITVPINVYCSPGGEYFHTSRKCEGLKNVPMELLGGDVRVCIAYSETDNEVENIVMDALETIKSLHLAISSS